MIPVSQVQGMHRIEISSRSPPLGKNRGQQEASLRDFSSRLKELRQCRPYFFGHEIYFNLLQQKCCRVASSVLGDTL